MKTLGSLFQPLTIKGLTLKNRIVMPAIGTRFTSDTGAVTQRLIDFHIERARGGVGLQIVEQAHIDQETPSCVLSIADDRMIPGLNELVEAVHEEGGKIAVQIGSLGFTYGFDYSTSNRLNEISTSKVRRLTRQFISAATRGQDAEFDAIEIHAAHRYLISQFLSPQTNQRVDKYGGNLEKRMCFLLEILQGIRERVGIDYPVFVRINGDGFDPEGLGLEDAKVLARSLELAGADVIDISAGTWKSPERTVPPMCFSRGCNVYLAAEIKQGISIPVITAGRINDPVLANEIIKEGKADLIAMGRALLADPFLPEKARQGDLEDVRMCVACNYCHSERLYKNKRLKCAVNAALGREREYALQQAQRRKKCFVIGGGPAGMEAAWTLKQRGHEVALWEKDVELGGQLLYAATPPYKDELNNILRWLAHQVQKTGVEIHLGHEVTAEFLNNTKPDEIILATGSNPIRVGLPGTYAQQVLTAIDVLKESNVELGLHIVIVGGGRVGCEIAEYLAKRGKEVTIIELLEKLAIDMEPRTRMLLLQRLEELGVNYFCQSNVMEIQNQKLTFRDKKGREKDLKADSVVLAIGSNSNNELQHNMLKQGKNVYLIGDCKKPGDIADAIHAGAHIGRLI